MSRNIRWNNCLLQNVLILVEALLELSEQQVDNPKPPLWVEWKEDKLRVTGYKTNNQTKRRSRVTEDGTKKEHLLQQIKDAGKNLQFSPKTKELDEIQYVLDCLKELGVREDEKSTKTHGYWKFSLKLKHQTATRKENLEVVERKWRKHPKTYSQNTSQESPTTDNGIDWRNICREMLEKYKRLSTNQLLFDDEDNKKELEDIHVPLALVERKKTEKCKQDDVSPEEGSRLYEPTYEEKQRFKHDDFLVQTLQRGEGKTQGKRIALIGEPGAGKTTLLQAIAFWILKKDLGFPIWISLAELDGKSIKDYLLQVWLEDAFAGPHVTIEQENAIATLFKENNVYLLLDGADEMSSPQPLQEISQHLTGFIKHGRVILSCRLNVWEANINALHDFETYRLLDFDYPQDVKRFINKWFANLTSQTNNPKNNRDNKAESLWDELKKPDRSRIQDLVKNPLRLALLCATWQSSEGSLPETKAGLYQQFVNEFYKWKENRFSITETEQEELNAALGRLAQKAIDGETSRFRLRHKLIREELGDPKKKNSLFDWALQLGWLNQVGIAAESSTEKKVYAFYHPTFEEYFAALVIDDWDYFLPRTHDNNNPQPVPNKRYRIFEPHWKEVILLWLGREDIEKSEKEDFINALVEFKSGCGDINFYDFRAYFIAAVGISEHKNCSKADEIVEKIISWSIGYFDSEKQEWFRCIKNIADGAKKVLKEIDTQRKTDALVTLIQNSQNKYIFWEALENLGKNAVNHPEILTKVLELIKKDANKLTNGNQILFRKIYFRNIKAIIALTELMRRTQDEDTQIIAASYLGKIDPANNQAIDLIVNKIKLCETKEKLKFIIYILGDIGHNNQKALDTLLNLISFSQDKDICITVIISLGEIACVNPKATTILQELRNHSSDEYILDFGKHILSKVNHGCKYFFSLSITKKPILSITRIPYELYKLQATSQNEETQKFLEKIIVKVISSNKIEAIDALVELIRDSQYRELRWEIIDTLGEIGAGNKTAIDALVELINNSEEANIRFQAVENLGEIDPNNPIVIDTLIDLISIRQQIIFPSSLLSRIGEFGYGNPKAINALVELIKNSDNDYRKNAAENLNKILTNKYMVKVVVELKETLSQGGNVNNVEQYKDCVEVLWKCAQNMTYPEFYQAWSREEQAKFSEII